MKAAAAIAFFVGVMAVCAPARPLAAQLSLTVSSSPVVLTPPDSNAYTAGVTAFTSVSVTLDCRSSGGGNGACQIDWFNAGLTFQMDYQITGAGSGCEAATNIGTTPVPNSTSKLAAAKDKSSTCSFTLNLRAKGLTITTFLSAVTYLQALTMTAKRLP